jgi:hypothetical protein
MRPPAARVTGRPGVKERAGRSRAAVLALLLAAGPAAAQQQPHGHGRMEGSDRHAAAFVTATLLATHVSPAIGGRALTEAYVTQPVLGGHAQAGGLHAHGMLNLEALTLRRGELAPGVWGEGYIDRRHPHTLLHEAVLGVHAGAAADVALSMTAGRGFVPFGTDDPMARPFARYPANHHLAQVLERWLLAGAARWRDVAVEAALFNGDEPVGPRDVAGLARVGDSWSVRLTAWPVAGVEVQGGVAALKSPELRGGGGADHHKRGVSARVQRSGTYGLLEWARTEERAGARGQRSFGTVLGEAARVRGAWRVAVRVERTERPEEERTYDPFRTPRPHVGPLLGETRWTTVSARLEHGVGSGRVRATPFVELARAHVADTPRSAFRPAEHYGSAVLWSASAGVRVDGGGAHGRVGRYGAAVRR